MSQENMEVVRRIYEAWARRVPGPADVLDAEIEYVNPPGAVEPGTRSSLAAFSRAVEQVFVEGWESWRFEPERFTPCGDRVAVVLLLGTWAGKSGRGGGATVGALDRP